MVLMESECAMAAAQRWCAMAAVWCAMVFWTGCSVVRDGGSAEGEGALSSTSFPRQMPAQGPVLARIDRGGANISLPALMQTATTPALSPFTDAPLLWSLPLLLFAIAIAAHAQGPAAAQAVDGARVREGQGRAQGGPLVDGQLEEVRLDARLRGALAQRRPR